MTVSEAIFQITGRGPGFTRRGAVRYAQFLLEDGETVAAAVTADIRTAVTVSGVVRREKFPGVAVLTDRRAFAVCALPGIRRAVSVQRWSCEEKPAALRYAASFSDGQNSFSLSLNPEDGERFSRCIAVLEGRGEAFDSVEEPDGGLLNPVLVRNRSRARRAREARARQRAKRKTEPSENDAVSPPSPENSRENAVATAARLAAELESAKKKGPVEDTDPRAVAARLAAELAAEESKSAKRDENKGGTT